MLFEVQRTTVHGRPALRVRGELDIATAPQLAEAVTGVLEAGPASLVVDLTETTFLDSSGARQLVRTARAADRLGVALQVVCPTGNRPVRLVLDLLDLQQAVPIVEKAGFAGGGVGS
ncbi:STAS domain-containing protein [Blastococcus sp. URHD0036]|uniref:STAS domain-containing protein n=1 Tax=Blastococcus sp. URHD0036 TaxID=1380356 RepID=UPI00068DC361|nr:STAS domain-containing protein [Blastococcus sp. URHD0036]